jgi:hypothetical protein
MLSWEVATAQPPPWAGGPTPPAHLYGYSPLVHTIELFPSKTSAYSQNMFGPNGGRRVYPALVVNPRRPSPPCAVVIEVRDAPRVPTGTNLAPAAPAPGLLPAAAFVPVGPVTRPLPVQGLHRFDH